MYEIGVTYYVLVKFKKSSFTIFFEGKQDFWWKTF